MNAVRLHSFRLCFDRFYHSVSLQPEDWDDREYIDDPDDVKPEVTCLVNMVAISKKILFLLREDPIQFPYC